MKADESDSGYLPPQTEISQLFNQLQATGTAYNGGGTAAAMSSMLSMGCAQVSGSKIVRDQSELGLKQGTAVLPEFMKPYALQLGQSGLDRLISSGCASLTGQTVSIDSQTLISDAGNELILGLLTAGKGWANGSELPFLSRLELETGSERGKWISSVTTVQPLWRDDAQQHHVFTQLAWRQVEGEKTVNAGLAYRHLNDEKTAFYGANVFFDHGFSMNHNRMSLGLDMQTSLLGGSVNKYIPLSGWKSRDALWEERVAAGFDAEIHGQVPDLPSWTGSFKAYQWDGSDDQYDDQQRQIKKTRGYVAAVEYAPVPALAVRGGVRHENNEAPSAEVALRFNLNLSQPLDMQFKQKLELASVEDRIYQKVTRENTIRVQERRKSNGLLSVTETVGANTVSGQPGVLALSVGQIITMPATVVIGNTPGAVARLRFADGAILTVAQGTTVTIETGAITLVTGTIQYTSGAAVVVVNVPGGVITLLGTDIDVQSDGTLSTVRVREGSVRLDGTVAGSATISSQQMAQSNAGTVGTVAAGTATYIAHTDDVSEMIDRVAQPVSGMKVAPYPVQAPRLTATTTIPGQTITIGLKFNIPVTVTGGPPRLNFTLNGNNRVATLSGGSGTNDLLFSYVLQALDSGSNDLTVTSFDLNGATVTGDGKTAVTTIADTVLDLGASIGSSATLTMNFLTNAYSLLGTSYNSLSSFLTAASGSFARSSIGTYFDANGVLQTASNNTPRFDHDPVTKAPKGLLIEEQRINYAPRSEISGAVVGPLGGGGSMPTGWAIGSYSTLNASIVDVGTEDGRSYFDLRIQGVNNTGSYIFPHISFNNVAIPATTGQIWTASIWARIIAGSKNGFFGSPNITPGLGFQHQNSGAYHSDGVTPVSGILTTSNQRIYTVHTVPAGTITHIAGRIFMYISNTMGTTVDITLRLSAPQIERGSFMTSYIPTTGSAVTRQSDQLIVPTGTWFNSTQSTLMAQAQSNGIEPGTAATFADINDNSFSQRFQTRLVGTTAIYSAIVTSGNTVQAAIQSGSGALSQSRKMALAAGQNDSVLYAEGVNRGTDTGLVMPTGQTRLRVGTLAGGTSEFLNGNMQVLEYYPTRLPNATLQTMTTP